MASLLHTFISDLVEAFQFVIVVGVLVVSAFILLPGQHQQPEENNAVFQDDDLVGSIVSFLPLSFRFTAAVNRRFQQCYRRVHNDETTTSFQLSVHTVAAAKIWLAELGQSSPADRACNVAAQFGRLEILQYFKQQGCEWSAETCELAVIGGHFLLLQWMRTPNDRWGQCPWSRNTCTTAAKNGHLNILQWARANSCGWNTMTCSLAARNGHFHILQWARAYGCDWNSWTCAEAALNGHLHVLQWARANGCGWDALTCSAAARNGHLHILQWARANGCDWNEWTCAEAARSGHLHILQWARVNGCDWDVQFCADLARRNGHGAVIDWIDANI
jgi:hypothetical protein